MANTTTSLDPTDLIPRVKLTLLESLLKLGLDEKVACKQADIDPALFLTLSTLYPAYHSELMAQQLVPIIDSWSTIINNLKDPKIAMWYLENRKDSTSLLKDSTSSAKQEEELSTEVTEETIAIRNKFEQELLAQLSKKQP